MSLIPASSIILPDEVSNAILEHFRDILMDELVLTIIEEFNALTELEGIDQRIKDRIDLINIVESITDENGIRVTISEFFALIEKLEIAKSEGFIYDKITSFQADINTDTTDDGVFLMNLVNYMKGFILHELRCWTKPERRFIKSITEQNAEYLGGVVINGEIVIEEEKSAEEIYLYWSTKDSTEESSTNHDSL